jgi:hypothetical protein
MDLQELTVLLRDKEDVVVFNVPRECDLHEMRHCWDMVVNKLNSSYSSGGPCNDLGKARFQGMKIPV